MGVEVGFPNCFSSSNPPLIPEGTRKDEEAVLFNLVVFCAMCLVAMPYEFIVDMASLTI
jgi:hypothetical protein